MRKKLAISLFLIVCVFSSVLFAADKKEDSVTDLLPWKGHNVSRLKLYESKAGDRFFAAVTKHAPKGYTQKMVKDHFYQLFALKFRTMDVVDEDTIIIDNKLTGDYSHIGTFTKIGKKHTLTWHIFKTESKEMIAAGYRYFLLLPYHQHGKNFLRHCHFRYGNQNFDFLATDPSMQKWWPTVYQPAETDEAKIMEAMTKKARLQASILPPLK